ncbi:MAG: glycosyltransferase [Chitinophagales bacterium]|nr:glycosyltransferase [Chitinophagales bacterium]
MNSPQTLSIILPCYNPGAEWVAHVLSATYTIEQKLGSVELIVVNDGSIKPDLLNELRAAYSKPELKLINLKKNTGKGYALRQGVAEASGNLIIYTDIDFPYKVESFMEIYRLLKKNQVDVAIGVRGDDYYKHLSASRIRVSKFLRMLIKTLLLLSTDDTQCGLKGFNLKGRKVFLQTTINRYLFDLEFIFLAAQENLTIVTSEVKLRPEVSLTKMNWKILFQESLNFLRIFILSIFSKPK